MVYIALCMRGGTGVLDDTLKGNGVFLTRNSSEEVVTLGTRGQEINYPTSRCGAGDTR